MLISLMRGAAVEMMPTVLPLVYMMMAGVEGSGATGLNCWFATACLPLKNIWSRNQLYDLDWFDKAHKRTLR